MKTTKAIRNIFTLFILSAIVLIAPPPAQASITVVPMIVIMQGRDRFAEVTLVNISDEVKSYELHWLFYKQDDKTGSYQMLDKSFTDFDLSKNIVFSPKRVTLKPQEPQKIRLALRLKDAPPPPGEYRAHLEFRLVPKAAQSGEVTRQESANAGDGQAGQEQGQKGIKLAMGVNVSYSIPIIYRVGEGESKGVMHNITMGRNKVTGGVELNLDIIRTGFFGSVGAIRIYYTPPGKSEYKIGEIRNANVFSEVKKRTFNIPTDVKDARGGRFRLVYDNDGRGGKKVIFDEKIVNAQ